MLTDILIYILGSFVNAVRIAFSAFTLPIPSQFVDSVTFFVSRLNYISGFINIPDIFAAFGWFLLFTTYWFSIKLILWVLSLLPFVGIKSKSPKL